GILIAQRTRLLTVGQSVDLQTAYPFHPLGETNDLLQRTVSPPKVHRHAEVEGAWLMPPPRGQVEDVARLKNDLDGPHLAREGESLVIRMLGVEATEIRQTAAEGIGIEPRRVCRRVEIESLAADNLNEQILREVAVQRGR